MPLVFLHCPLRHATIEFFGIGVEVPPNSSMIISDVLDVNASDGCWDLHSHLLEVEVAILSGVPLGLAPHTLDEVELAVVFWIKIGNVPCVLHVMARLFLCSRKSGWWASTLRAQQDLLLSGQPLH